MKIVFQNGGDGFFDKIIKYVTKTNWTHSFLVLNETIDGQALIIQSAPHGGVEFNVKNGYGDSQVFELVNPTDDISCIFPFIGDEYGWLDAIGFGIAKLLKLKSNPITSGMICIELVTFWLKQSPVGSEFAALDVNTASFDDVYNIVSKSTSFKKLS